MLKEARRRFSTKDATKDELPDVKRSEKKIFSTKDASKDEPPDVKRSETKIFNKSRNKS